MNDHSAWTLTSGSATHENGLKLVFSGVPGTDDFEVAPERMPDSLSAREQTRLLREGVAAYEAFVGAAHAPTSKDTAQDAPRQRRPKRGGTAGVDVQVKRRRSRGGGTPGRR